MFKTLIRDAGIILLITVLLAEVSLRVYHQLSPSYIFESRTYLDRWRSKPGEWHMGIQLNSGGFMDTEIPARDPDTYRIIALGDSFAFGVVPYVDNYLTLLEDRLTETGDFEVLNMGIPGTGPENHLELLLREGLSLDPDMVLVSLFIGNDLTDGLSEEVLDYLVEERSFSDTLAGLARMSYLGAALNYLLIIRPRMAGTGANNSLEMSTAAGEAFEYCESCLSTDWSTMLTIETETARQFFTNEPSTRTNVERVAESFRKIKEVCDERGIALGVVLIPDTAQVNEEYHDVLIQRGYEDQREYWDHLYPNRLITGMLDDLSVPYLDLYATLVEANEDGEVYIPRNTHWNIRGNHVAAEAIHSWLQQTISPPLLP